MTRIKEPGPKRIVAKSPNLEAHEQEQRGISTAGQIIDSVQGCLRVRPQNVAMQRVDGEHYSLPALYPDLVD